MHMATGAEEIFRVQVVWGRHFEGIASTELCGLPDDWALRMTASLATLRVQQHSLTQTNEINRFREHRNLALQVAALAFLISAGR